MRDLKKEDFVGKMTYYGPIVDAGFDARIRGNKADQFSFAIDYGDRGRFAGQSVWMSPACAIIDVMAREPQKYPYAIEWQEWFYGKLGLTTWQLRARDGVGDPDEDESDFDAEEDDKPKHTDRRLRLPGF